MNLDLKTAMAVREREDGLLEKDSFDLSTALPVDTITPVKEAPTRVYTEPNWVLSVLDNAKKETIALFTNPNEMVYTGRTALKKEKDIPAEDKDLAQPAPGRPGYFEAPEKQPRWSVAIEQAVNVAFVGYMGKVGFDVVKTELGVRALARDISKEANILADESIKVMQPATKLKGIGAAFDIGTLKSRDILVKQYEEAFVRKLSAIEVVGSKVQTVAEGELSKTKMVNLLYSELKDLNLKLGEAGQAIIKRPKVGDTVAFQKGEESLSGVIKAITGNIAEVNLGKGSEAIIVAINQLSSVEAPKQPILPPKEPQGGTIKPETTVTQLPEARVEEQPKPIIKNLNISEEAKATIEESSAQIKPELEKIKGKPLTHDEVVEAAQQSNILSKVISREESKVFEARILRTRQNLAAMVEGKGVTQEFIDTLKTVKSFGTDAARKLGSLRIGAESSEFNIKTKLVNKLLENNVEIDDIIKASEGVDFNNQEQVTKLYRQFIKPKVWDLLNEYRYINLLSSPKTHIVNTFSNLIQVSGLAPGTKLFAGDVKGSTAFYRGAWNAIGEAKVKALDALKGKSLMERPDLEHIPSDSKLLKWGRWIPQALEASDVFFRTIAYEGELAAQLAKGTAPEEAAKVAKDKASYYVFRKALDPGNKTGQGKLLSAIDSLTTLAYKARTVPGFGRLISWYIPFVQTPMNIAKQMIEYSPVGFTTMPGAKDKKGQLAKALLGSFIFGAAAYLVSKNETTWEVPTGKKEKDLFFAAGRQPFSIKIGNTWIGYSRLGPLAFPIAIPAAIKNYTLQNPSSATDNNLQKTAKVIGGLGEFFASMSYVEGIGQLMGLIKNAPGAASKLLMQGPSQLIPVSSLQRWVNNFIIDPIYRKSEKDMSAESIIDEARKSIIFGTKGLPAYENPDGEESRRSYPGLNAFSPIPVTKSNYEYEEEYKQYIEERKEDLIEKKESGDEPRSRTRRRR